MSCSDSREVNLRIFFSYGHDGADVYSRIISTMEERGYEVWFDKDELKGGMNWRARIYDGIVGSDGVVSCLTKHSVRNPGVCLDELSIALSTDKSIKPILLEPESKVKPPASIASVQWLDMSDWKERLEKNPESFETWFCGKMEELFRILEADEYKSFSGEMGEIANRLGVVYDESRQKALLSKRFYGREWLANKVGDWLTTPGSRQTCLLVSKPAIGKSAFAAYLAHYGCPSKYDALTTSAVFCRRGQHFSNSPANIVKTIAYLLARRLPEYRCALLRALEKDGLPLDESSLFERLLSAPLNESIDGGHAPVCIIIDGLDECGVSGGANALAQTLASFTASSDRRLPSWVKLLVHTRDEENVLSAFGSKVHKIHLDGGDAANMADITQYLESELEPHYGDESDFQDSINLIAERSQGVFLYVTLMTDCLVSERGESLSAYVSKDDFPIGLDSEFTAWFRWFFPDVEKYGSDYRSLLGVLAVAPSPLPEAEIIQLFGWDENMLYERLSRIKALLERGSSFFGGMGLHLSHKYIGEWLGDKGLAGQYYSSGNDARSLLARAYLDAADADLSRLSDYGVVYLLDLLKESGFEADYERLRSDASFHQRVHDLVKGLRKDNRLSLAIEVAKIVVLHFRDCSGKPLSDLRYVVGELYGKCNNFPLAESYLSEAIESYEKLPDCAQPDIKCAIAMAKTELGCVLRKVKCADEAERFLEDALAMCRDLPEGRYLNELAVVCNNLGFFRGDEGNSSEAISLYREALGYRRVIAAEDPDAYLPSLAKSCNNLGVKLRQAGRYDEAEPLLKEAWMIRSKLAEKSPAQYLHLAASSLSNLAQFYLHTEDYAKAEECNLEVFDMRLALAEMEPFAYLPSLAYSHRVQARILIAQGREKEAIVHLEKALEIYNDFPHLEKQRNNVTKQLRKLK